MDQGFHLCMKEGRLCLSHWIRIPRPSRLQRQRNNPTSPAGHGLPRQRLSGGVTFKSLWRLKTRPVASGVSSPYREELSQETVGLHLRSPR